MKLTHHSTPSRSFVLLTIIVLCTVYAALVLTRINKLYLMESEPVVPTTQEAAAEASATFTQATPADISNWIEFADEDYPITFLRPQGWRITWSDDLEDIYILSVTRTNPPAQMRIFLTKDAPGEIKNLPSQTFITKNGYTATNYNNQIYVIKEGEYYYTFDGNAAEEYTAELAAMVDSAVLESAPAN